MRNLGEKKLPPPNHRRYTELEKKSKVITSFEDFCKEPRLLERGKYFYSLTLQVEAP